MLVFDHFQNGWSQKAHGNIPIFWYLLLLFYQLSSRNVPKSIINIFYTEFIWTGAEPSPALLVASTKRRGRKCSKDVPDGKETPHKNTEESAPKSRGRGRKPKPKPGNFHFFWTKHLPPLTFWLVWKWHIFVKVVIALVQIKYQAVRTGVTENEKCSDLTEVDWIGGFIDSKSLSFSWKELTVRTGTAFSLPAFL